ncbi:hypothetical protein BGZ73_008674 [Actinomortierella ambigua]|nr:hypothetical protein BGZ73_008674 [Actinomortierella ambigua]
MIILRRALVLALAGLTTLPGLLAQTVPLSITFSDASGTALGTQSFAVTTCLPLDYPDYATAVTADNRAAVNTYQDPFCQIAIAATVGGWTAAAVPSVVAIRWEGPAPSQFPTGYLNMTVKWPEGMVYQKKIENVFVVDAEKGKKVVIVVSIVLAIGVALGAWKVYKAASYVKPPELMKKKKEAKDREYTGVVGNKKVKKKHAYYRKPAPGTLGGGGAEKQERYRDDDDEEEDRFDEYGRRMYKDENGEWQVVERDSSDDTDSEEEERRKKAEKRRRRAQPGRSNNRRGSEDSNSSRDHDTSSAAANRALNGKGFLKVGGGKRSSAGSSTLASHSPMATTTTFRQNQYTGVSGRASPQPVLIDMQETNYQQRRPLGAPAAPSPSSSSFHTTSGSANTFNAPPPSSSTVTPQASTVMTYNLPPPAHTQIDLMRFDTSSPAPSGRSNNSYGGSYDPHQNPYQQRQHQQQSEVIVSMPQQYQNNHHPTSPTRRGGYSANQRF